MKKWLIFSSIIGLLLFAGCSILKIQKPQYDYSKMNKITKKVHKRVEKFLTTCINDKYPVRIPPSTRIDSIIVNKKKKQLDIYLNSFFAYIPFREENTSSIYKEMKKRLGCRFRKYSVKIYAPNQPIEQLIPNYYRTDPARYDSSRMPKQDIRQNPVVRNISKPWRPTNGLHNRNIALWHSHGWYYNHQKDRWEWQRPRLFQTVEDLLPMSFTIPYLIPMLENAGANVFIPRERDLQTHEVVIDNDLFDSTAYIEKTFDENNKWRTGVDSGFAIGNPPYTQGVNSFKLGTYRIVKSDTFSSAQINWIPDIPETGEYAIYISYFSSDSNITDAHYTIYHTGDKTDFLINQQIGGSTWIYLGKFKFKAGFNPNIGKVVLSNKSIAAGKYVTADAVRFGGGRGNIARNGSISGRPRFVEAARYYLQYAGMPDTLVYSLNDEKNDYTDDYQCRGEWVNYLKGAPFGPNKNRNAKGLGIPIDLSLAFHTDAGIAKNDTVIGTLVIYCTKDADSALVFPDGMSRLANRDFADLLQTQIVEDIRTKYDPLWNRRDLWDKDYSEAYRPNVPAVLLELLSHQSYLDMKFFHYPKFRFDVSRAIYKAILKFIATQYQYNYIVQPLPVSHFQATFTGEREVTLKWQPTSDPLEKTAIPQKYIVYTRIDENNFNNGILVDRPQVTFNNISPGVIYSYKVTAVNRGGESFPSEILAVCWLDNETEPILIINGFDRISGPAMIEADQFTGFVNFLDQGVPDKYDFDYTGDQFNFMPASHFTHNDAPGYGASYGNFETTVIPGNTFDFPYTHGKSIKDAGYSFVSVSDEVIMDRQIDIVQYKIVDLILGEEKETELPKPTANRLFKTFPKNLQREIDRFCASGGNLFISGAYVGTDLFENFSEDSSDINFAQKTLRLIYRTNHAVKTGDVFSVDSTFLSLVKSFKFNTDYHPKIYTVEAPDAIEPADSLSHTILRYSENQFSAAIAYRGDYKVIVFGFPFETILTQENRDRVMRAVIECFKSN